MFNYSKTLTLWLLALPTVIFYYLSLLIIIKLWYPQGLDPAHFQQHIIHFSVVYLLWMIVFFMFNIFETRYLPGTGKIIINLISAMTVNLFVAVSYFYFQPDLIITPRRFLLSHILLSVALLIVWYLCIQYIFRQYFIEKFYLYTSGEVAENFLRELQEHRYIGMHFAGVINHPPEVSLSGSAMSIALPDKQNIPPEVLKQFYSLRRRNITFYDYRTLYENLTRKVFLPGLNEAWFLTHINYRKKRLYQFIKRLLDLVAGLLGLVVFLVLYPLVLVVIKLTSPGPVLFRQQRVGQYGTIITVYKFRSMSGVVTDTWTSRNDPRITSVGKILRRTRIDELPQAINLLQGTMSLVGPRPEQPHISAEMEQQIPFYDERHVVKPGLTGWGQLNVYARSMEETKTKLQYDLYYIKHRSLGFDLEIILKTVYHIFTSNSG